jgi:catechol 2,3-dioxygenase-like lactoylglutathione lyase family enzyme
MARAIDHTLRKFHASLNVSDLARSVAFYRALLGTEPAKVRSDYAKFDIAEPPLVLSLIPGKPASGGNLNHVGLRVRTAEELVAIQQRLEASGHRTEREDGVECCYARQTKFWITDPDSALWEIYVFHEDIDEHGDAAPPRAEPLRIETVRVEAPKAWAHRLREPIPARIPFDDNTLHEVRLEGSINTRPDADHRATLLDEAWRAMRPGAFVYVHGLAGDSASEGEPHLPGPAAAVQHVPATAAVVDELARTGFADICIDKLSETAYFEVNGVPMRELQITARKPGHRPKASTHRAVYLGPLAEVTDDYGNIFRRGVVVPMNIHDWQALSNSRAASDFLLLKPVVSKGDAACSAPAVKLEKPAAKLETVS